MFVTVRDGLRLHVRIQGKGEPLLLIHGFTGSVEAWGEESLRGLSQGFQVVAVDLLGHGASDVSDDPQRYRTEEMLRDLCQVLDAVAIESARWLGYSMGGRIALAGAIRRPSRVSALILESASPGLEGEKERRGRRRADEALAEGILRGGMEAFVDHWMGLPLFATQGKLPERVQAANRERRLKNDPVALAACLRGNGTGVQPSFWEELGNIRVPTLILAGEEDRKFTEISGRMSEEIPGAELRVIPRSGHSIHLENPFAWLAAVRTFRPEGKDREEDSR
ncbi:MAG: 2-succinyl-6-hydroxy-2,4-cyclohexadiene-1-carboxylate synthase [Longimicrobiales bacterium]